MFLFWVWVEGEIAQNNNYKYCINTYFYLFSSNLDYPTHPQIFTQHESQNSCTILPLFIKSTLSSANKTPPNTFYTKKKEKKNWLNFITTGICFRYAELSSDAVSILGYPGELFMRALKMIVLPFIICCIILGTFTCITLLIYDKL